ncbi:MAG: RIP metalloprotease RseP, partial [Nitrospinota bacterium]
QELTLQIERQGERLSLRVVPQQKRVKNIFGEEMEIGFLGIAPKEEILEHYSPHLALLKGVERTGQIIQLTLVSIVKLIQGKISPRTIAGPVGIAEMIGSQAKAGLLQLANLTALLSISLGILNLFPIPILDGGHILFFTIEGIAGKPISPRKLEIAQQVGIVVLISLMLLAFYNDLMRIFTQ